MSEERPPLLVRARIKKLSTDDGLLILTEDVHVGDVFIVDLSTRGTMALLNQQYHVPHEKDVVQCAETGGWLAIECLELFV